VGHHRYEVMTICRKESWATHHWHCITLSWYGYLDFSFHDVPLELQIFRFAVVALDCWISSSWWSFTNPFEKYARQIGSFP